MQRPVSDIGKRSVFISDETRKGASAKPHHSKAGDTRHGLDYTDTVDFDAGGEALGTRRTQGCQLSRNRGVRNLDGRDLHALHLRIEADELTTQEPTIALE